MNDWEEGQVRSFDGVKIAYVTAVWRIVISGRDRWKGWRIDTG